MENILPRRVLSFLVLLMALLPIMAIAADLKFPPLTGRVVDQTQLLSPQVALQLDHQLQAFEQKTGDQVVVAILASLQNVPIEEYGYQLGRAWGIGQKGKNNGVLFIVAPNERKIRIEVGYGLEGTLTDAQSKLIIADVVTPKFKAGQMQQGVVDGVQAILQAIGPDAAGQDAPAPTAEDTQPQEQPPAHINFLILLLPIIVVILLARMAGRFPGGSFLSGLLLGSLFGGRGGGGGSGGDDNFSGGGGSFGGGGASGDY